MVKLTVYLQAETAIKFEVELDEKGNVINLEDCLRVAKYGTSPEWQIVGYDVATEKET